MGRTESAEAPYPPAPWQMGGEFWAGLFRTERPLDLPDGFRPVLGHRWITVLLVRYREGTLRYDELVVGAPVRHGWRIGLFVTAIWVDAPASLWGGRRIWGLPKQKAQFAWNGGDVRISDDAGLIAALTVNNSLRGQVPAWLPAPFFGQRDGEGTYTVATLRARLHAAPWRRASAVLRICEWSPRFPYRAAETPGFAVAAPAFRMIFPPPKILRGGLP